MFYINQLPKMDNDLFEEKPDVHSELSETVDMELFEKGINSS